MEKKDPQDSIQEIYDMVHDFVLTMSHVFGTEVDGDLMKEILRKFELEQKKTILQMDITQLEGEYAGEFADLLRETIKCHLLLTRALAVKKEIKSAKTRESTNLH